MKQVSPLPKSVFVMRMTEAEAIAFEELLQGADAKIRLLYQALESFETDAHSTKQMKDALSITFSDVRASELLAPP